MKRPQMAAVVTEYRPRFPAQHIIDRLLWGYPWDGRHHQAAIGDYILHARDGKLEEVAVEKI